MGHIASQDPHSTPELTNPTPKTTQRPSTHTYESLQPNPNHLTTTHTELPIDASMHAQPKRHPVFRGQEQCNLYLCSACRQTGRIRTYILKKTKNGERRKGKGHRPEGDGMTKYALCKRTNRRTGDARGRNIQDQRNGSNEAINVKTERSIHPNNHTLPCRRTYTHPSS